MVMSPPELISVSERHEARRNASRCEQLAISARLPKARGQPGADLIQRALPGYLPCLRRQPLLLMIFVILTAPEGFTARPAEPSGKSVPTTLPMVGLASRKATTSPQPASSLLASSSSYRSRRASSAAPSE